MLASRVFSIPVTWFSVVAVTAGLMRTGLSHQDLPVSREPRRDWKVMKLRTTLLRGIINSLSGRANRVAKAGNALAHAGLSALILLAWIRCHSKYFVGSADSRG